MMQMYLSSLAKVYGFSLDVPVSELPKKIYDILMYGNGGERIEMTYNAYHFSGSYEKAWEGFVNNLQRRYNQTSSEGVKWDIERYMRTSDCPACHGKRLKKEALAVTVGGKNIAEVCEMAVDDLATFTDFSFFTSTEHMIADSIIKEIDSRLSFLRNVGLGYLTLSRSAATLSGGESQRIRLATQIGSQLVNVLYILDEPSIGLHQRDNQRLICSLKDLRDIGNSVIVVEHDKDMMLAADYVIDMGPKAGRLGGDVVFAGTPREMLRTHTLTSQYLNGERAIEVPAKRREGNGHSLWLRGAKGNNLKNVDVEFPLGKLICVTGVSGSGKSTLINETLQPILSQKFYRSLQDPLEYGSIEGLEYIDKVVNVDQSPLGRTPRSNPATYTGVFPIYAICLSAYPKRRYADIRRDASPSMSVEGDARLAKATGTSVLR